MKNKEKKFTQLCISPVYKTYWFMPNVYIMCTGFWGNKIAER